MTERVHVQFACRGKLRVRFKRWSDIHFAGLSLGAAIDCPRFLDELF
ncbi:hypothetical protein [Burkholderia cepacia]|nr:hypothetical protein [Burkholderia cepacia]